MDNYPNVSAYCQALKLISDQLHNVGAPVSNDRLVLQLVSGLSDGYDGVATLIQQSDPLPPFYKVRLMLLLEETCKLKVAANSTALITTHSDSDTNNGAGRTSSPQDYNNSRNHSGRGRGNNRHRGGGNRGRNYGGGGRGNNGGSGGNRSGNRNNNGQQQQQQNRSTGQWAWVPYGSWAPPISSTPPPCPYLTSSWAPAPNPGPGLLGPRPQQAYIAQTPSNMPKYQPVFFPTDIATAMQSMTLQPPDENWYMDTGASSHMTSNSGSSDGDPTFEMQ
ncbi:hypothetical protein RND81_11G033700 [Saponaria officinalis]|uniref:Uncharacterized protein n=1 Tax=Saponaria officinalis TaxID=3572 RepID=A0AAW1HI95_SAPOF